MHRTAIGRMAGPDSPPVSAPSFGRYVSVSMAIPSSVLISESPWAPARTQASATSTMFVVSAVSFANTGSAVIRLTAPTTSAASSG